MLQLCYGMGLRVGEVIKLKIADIDSKRMQVLIEIAKGKSDRYVNLLESVLLLLRKNYKTYKPKLFYLKVNMVASIQLEACKPFSKKCHASGQN